MSEDSSQLLENLLGALGDNPSEKIGQMLSVLSGSNKEAEESTETESKEPETDLFGGFDFDMLMKLQGVMGQLSSQDEDKRSALLYAIKPFLSEDRRPQVDRAVKLLKLSQLAKTAQELDLFKNLL